MKKIFLHKGQVEVNIHIQYIPVIASLVKAGGPVISKLNKYPKYIRIFSYKYKNYTLKQINYVIKKPIPV